ncbi:PKD domain-containing protein, partial [Leucobacter sp. wl10]|uniref:PKD domain-containing protein n=1 Tax=Leucobacter sp. wl10 TaxID=2304677 RepID=UPI000E5B49DF
MASGGRRLRAVIAALSTAALVAGAIVFGTTTAAAADDPPPTPPPLLQRDASVVTGDPLPTVQIDNGYVWSQTTIGTTVYAAGQFQNARAALAAPGTSLTPRSNILAFDINSGALLPFAPAVNGTIKAVTPSPDGNRIYIGGSFNSVNGQSRWNIAALDARTGQLVPGFNPSIGGNGVYALAADADAVYVGGLFTQANGTARSNLAAFAASNGALRTDWDAQPDQQVDAMVMDPGGQQVVVGGRFANVDGDGKWRGLVSITASTGEVDADWAGTEKVKNGWGTGSARGKAGIFALNADDKAVYGTGWVFANAQVGNLEGVFSLESDSGSTRWIADCLGDHYGVYSTGSVVYSTSHTHACSTMNLWPEQSPRENRFAQAMTADARGILPRQPYAGATYANWEGERAPSAYAWYPDFFTGTATGLGQAGLSITGAGNVISIAGEFPGVNNRYFQGIVRFSSAPPGGAKDGPRTTTAAWGAPTASTAVPGRIRLSMNGTWDRDDRDLTYELTRDGTSGVIDSATYSTGWWNVPTVSLVDATVAAGQSYTYRITVKDGDGNSVASQPVTATASTAAAAEYASAVIDDGASLYYPLGDSTADWAGANPPVFGGGVQAQQPSAVKGSGTGFSNFSGSTTGSVSTTTRPATPKEFTTELWFKTTTNRGGKLIGYGNAQTGASSSYDRQIYMRDDGRLSFGVYPGATKVVTSSSSYNDGQWHHAAATLNRDGMKLYVDGRLVAEDPSVTEGESFNGYWRIGGDNLGSWPGRPSSDWFAGAIDEVAVYPQALGPARVATHYAIGTGLEAPTANFTATADGLAVDFDGSGSTASGGGIVEYTWDFGDGSPVVTGASAAVAHTYAETGTYTAKLTVRDSRGLVGTAEESVSVVGPNQLPTASFTPSASGLTVTVDGSGSADADGTVESYSWDWGDGSEPGSGALASHAYAAAGTYTVTLTATDDRGGSSSTTREVEVTHAAPAATFEASASGLTVETDAGETTASDGATLSYAWDWGDGSEPGSGAQASHTYAADGTYEITLTATDSLGASTEFTRTVSVESTVYAALDEFERVVSNGWGAAPIGGVWTTMLGSASAASTDGARGVLALAPGGTRQLALQGLSLMDSESVLDYRLDYGPASGAGYVGMTLRQTAADGYTIHAWHRSNGSVWLVAQRGGTVIGTQPISGLSWAQGDQFTIKTEVSGSTPTTLRAKIWPRGGSEPQAWQLTATDSTAALQQAGFASVRSNLGASAAGVGRVAFDRVTVRDLAAPAPNAPPVAD